MEMERTAESSFPYGERVSDNRKEMSAYRVCYKHSMYYITRMVMDIAIIWWIVTQERLTNLVAEYRAYVLDSLGEIDLEAEDLPGTPWG